MKKYRIIAGYFVDEFVVVEDYECEQDALDKVIDNYESLKYSACFCNPEDPNLPINEDEYVVGGNHGLALFHGGVFSITQVPFCCKCN